MTVLFHDRDTAERYLELEASGIRIGLYDPDVDQALEWCECYCQGDFATSEDNMLICEDVYKLSLDVDADPSLDPRHDPEWSNRRFNEVLSEDVAKELERELLKMGGFNVPHHYFWFEKRKDAMNFKMFWGGK